MNYNIQTLPQFAKELKKLSKKHKSYKSTVTDKEIAELIQKLNDFQANKKTK